MDIDPLKSGTTTAIVAAAAAAWMPNSTQAGEWVPKATTIVDATGATGGRPALEFTIPPAEFNWPALAMDPATSRPYVAYTLNEDLWVSTRVGAGMGNCGTASVWLCESISVASEVAADVQTPGVPVV